MTVAVRTRKAAPPTAGPSTLRAPENAARVSRRPKRPLLKAKSAFVNKTAYGREPTPLARLPVEYDPYDPAIIEMRYEILERNLATIDHIPSFRVIAPSGSALPPQFTLRRPAATSSHSGSAGSRAPNTANRDVPPFPLYGAKLSLHLTSPCLDETRHAETYEGYLELNRTTLKRGARPKTRERLGVWIKLAKESVDTKPGACEELLAEYTALVRPSAGASDVEDLGAAPLVVGYFGADDGTRRGPIRDCLVLTRPI